MSLYITENRAIVEAAKSVSKQLSLSYRSSDDEWYIQLSDTDKSFSIYAHSLDCNGHAAASIASDKVATYDVLNWHDVDAAEHQLLKSVLDKDYNLAAINTMINIHGTVVVKPLHGSKGRGIRKASTFFEATEFMDAEDDVLWALSPYIDIDHEMRIIVHNGAIVLAYKKTDPVIIEDLKMFNANLGAKTQHIPLDILQDDVRALALRAASALNMTLCAVDIIADRHGNIRVLEINSQFSLERFALTSTENRRSVVTVYQNAIKEYFEN